MTKLHTLKRPSAQTLNVYETENVKSYEEYIVVAHYFLPASCVDFYVVEYDKENDEIYGWNEVIPNCGELGYTSLRELEKMELSIPVKEGDTVIGYLPVRVEFDEYWEPKKLGKVLEERNI